MTNHHDMTIIGSHPVDASLAHRLAPTGQTILPIKRRVYLSRSNGDPHAVFVGGFARSFPVPYEVFEPFYDEVERRPPVSGQTAAGSSESPSSGRFPCRPVSNEPRIRVLHDSLPSDGLHPFHLPFRSPLD